MNYITYFDENYVAKAIVMWNSLKRVDQDAKLHILFLTKKAYKLWIKFKNFKNDYFAYFLEDIENENLLKIKKQRSKVEYYWTLTPVWVSYCLEILKLKEFIYIDADLEFLNSQNLINNLSKQYDILITPHNYNPEYDQSKTSGFFCVQYIYFKNTKRTFMVVERWLSQCITWCYRKFEDNKFGDQKYLDEWPDLYKNIVGIINEKNFFIAPWNWQKTNLEINKIDFNKIHFIHWHGVHIAKHNYYKLPSYPVDHQNVKRILFIYVKKLFNISKTINYFPNTYDNYFFELKNSFKNIFNSIKVFLKVLLKIPYNYTRIK